MHLQLIFCHSFLLHYLHRVMCVSDWILHNRNQTKLTLTNDALCLIVRDLYQVRKNKYKNRQTMGEIWKCSRKLRNTLYQTNIVITLSLTSLLLSGFSINLLFLRQPPDPEPPKKENRPPELDCSRRWAFMNWILTDRSESPKIVFGGLLEVPKYLFFHNLLKWAK